MSDYLRDDITHEDISVLRAELKELDYFLSELDRDRGHGYKNSLNEKRLIQKFEILNLLIERIKKS